MLRNLAAAAAFVALAAAPAAAEQISYAATLNGVTEPSNTGSSATGTATITVDTATQTIDARIEIHGLRTDRLAQHLSHSRMGPMHLHRYQGDDVTLIMPFPFDDTYAATADGFTVTVSDFPYAEAAQRTGSRLDFAAFLAALAGDPIYLNVHTEAFGDGEISGRLVPAT